VKWLYGISVAWLLALGGVSAAPPVIQGQGLCRFILHDYPLSKANEDKINFIIADLLKRHEEAFGFTNDPDFRIRIRIFGRFEDYRKFALTNQANIETASSISNLAGYYSGRDQEVVTWRQRDPTYLANNILHECSHAMMHHQFRALPLWLDEGCAVYYQFPAFMRSESALQRLQGQWYQLKQWNDERSLPGLRTFLNLNPEEFRALDPTRSYLTGWSIFQLLMSTPDRRRALNAMIFNYQKPGATPPDCALLLNQFYPGGLARMEKDWHQWVASGSANVLGNSPPAGN
jgi:hypothetical protein